MAGRVLKNKRTSAIDTAPRAAGPIGAALIIFRPPPWLAQNGKDFNVI
jgi:hypothetical protein